MMRTRLVVLVLLCSASASTARAEIAFFASGRTLSVKGHRTEGASLVLTLRSGGEIFCEPSVIVRFAPDEVPYPEPEPEPGSGPTVAAPEPGDRLETNQRYAAIIDRVSAEQGVDPRLVRAVIQVESAYQHRAVSRKGAMGLMQLMPVTARRYGVADPYDAESNIEAGIKHLKSLLQRFSTRALALAAYNAGEAAVERFRGVPPYPETQAYVYRILKLVGR
jgi:soluble lytic murein transglycosylase-like protein